MNWLGWTAEDSRQRRERFHEQLKMDRAIGADRETDNRSVEELTAPEIDALPASVRRVVMAIIADKMKGPRA